MPTEKNTSQPVDIFLFAHQDDEFGVFYKIEQSASMHGCPICIYMTDGSNGDALPEIRNRESLKVLTKLGVKRDNILFLGDTLGIKDTKLCFSLSEAIAVLVDFLRPQKTRSIYCPAWEGGHPDHDALYVLTSKLIDQLNLKEQSWQYSLYNAASLRHPFFRVLRPLKKNGNPVSEKIPMERRIKYISYCASYKSQVKSWMGLMPLVAWHYFVDGHQYLQAVNQQRIHDRPHEGLLYYEKRGFMKWTEFQCAVHSLSHKLLY